MSADREREALDDAVRRAMLYVLQLSDAQLRAFAPVSFIRALEQDGFTVAALPSPETTPAGVLPDVETLAAALPNVPTVKYVVARGGRFNGAWYDRFAEEIVAALAAALGRSGSGGGRG